MKRALPLLLVVLLVAGCVGLAPHEDELPPFGPSSGKREPSPWRAGLQIAPPHESAPPRPVDGLQVDTLNAVRDGENLTFVGLIRNDGNLSSTSTLFDVEILGRDGEVLRSQMGAPLLELVEPGQRVPFRWHVHDPEGNVTGARVLPRGTHDPGHERFALAMGKITRAANGTFVVPAANALDGHAIATVASAHYDAEGALVAVGSTGWGVQLWRGGNATLYVVPTPDGAAIARSEFWGQAHFGVIARGPGIVWVD